MGSSVTSLTTRGLSTAIQITLMAGNWNLHFALFNVHAAWNIMLWCWYLVVGGNIQSTDHFIQSNMTLVTC